jgi:hypothetical protein
VFRRLSTCLAGLVALSIFVVAPPQVTADPGHLPLPGDWGWCVAGVVDGCIEAVTVISPEKSETIYTEQSALPSSLVVTVMCDSVGMRRSCDASRYEAVNGGPCKERATWPAGRMVVPDLLIDISWPQKIGWTVILKISTGNFRPAFTIGHGTTSAVTTDDGDGSFTYTYSALIETSYSASMPPTAPLDSSWSERLKEFLATAEATNSSESVHVQVWPRDHLLNPARSATGCDFYPFEGSWAEANAQSFSWSYSSAQFPDSVTNSTTPNKLSFTAQAPHYLPRVGSEPLQVMPARVQVFLPAAYFALLGYASLAEFDASSYKVTTEDGQVVSPSLTARDGGLLINLGVAHYSSPNPSIIFKPKGTQSAGSTGAAVAMAPLASTPAASPPLLTTKRASTAKAIASFAKLAVVRGSTISMAVSSKSRMVCRVVTGKLQATKKGSCRVVVTVKPRSGPKKIRAVTIVVKS